ncbi:hypothetical protein [Crenobacter cavernae]|uniref:Uncharacterized protein n=1 Tax=Crenobacter cavernae TaxID=2290923 RepID=A0ABY0FAI8_9NEIS|nr:hypothetical protein [Crenobacter cavernae]RXZ42668.1 hypothetical protein EBB06_12290 [Crenobacter cavernae]
MSNFSELWCVSWMPLQQTLNVETVDRMLRDNREVFSLHRQADGHGAGVPLFIHPSIDECEKFAAWVQAELHKDRAEADLLSRGSGLRHWSEFGQ